MGKRTVKNYPSPRLMQTIGATNQSPSEAIGELVANCFDARIGENKLDILIDLCDEKIVVSDDGKGMTDEILERAVCIAEDMSQFIERGENAKGHFGMGFKTSCSTLGKFYEIFTRPIGSDIEYHVSFDINDYSQRPSGADAWDVVIEDGPQTNNGPLNGRDHGTAFVIKSLSDKDIRASAVVAYLGEAFKGHIETGDSITVANDTGSYPAIPKVRAFIPGSKVPIDVACGPDNSLHIKGWVALDKQTHNDGLYGFNIYRHGQLVDSWNRDWFKSHLMTSRIFGEVEMDFLDATFYKQGLQQSEYWKVALKYMHEFLLPIVRASRSISRGGNINSPVEKKKIISALQSDYDIADAGPTDDNSESSSDDREKPESTGRSINNKVKTLIKEDVLILADGTRIPITLVEMTSNGHVNAPFDYIYNDAVDDEPMLQVVVYTDHPIFQGKDSQNTIRILATADAIFRVLIDRHGIDSHEAFNIKNQWILKRLESKDVD